MKPETQVRIGKATAILCAFRTLAGPAVATIRECAAQELLPEQTLAAMGLLYLFTLPLIASSVGLCWALVSRRLKPAIACFVIQVVWGLYSGIVAGGATLLFEAILIFAVLQGILGIWKMQSSTSPSTA
jgi:hypothetical protein